MCIMGSIIPFSMISATEKERCPLAQPAAKYESMTRVHIKLGRMRL